MSTSQVFASNVTGYQKGYTDIVKTQQQISSGVRIQTPADDPVGAARLLQLEQQKAELDQYSTNMTTATNGLTQQNAVLDSVNNVLQRARELTVQAGNGALADEDRGAIASELEQIQGQLMNLVNSKDANGQYLFAGSNSGTQPYTKNPDGTYSYNGDQTTLDLQVASATRLPVNDSGWSLFENIPNASRTYSTLTEQPVAADEQQAFLSQGLVTDDTQYDKQFRGGSPYTLELLSGTQFRITDASGQDVTTEASGGNGTFDPTASDGTTIGFRGVQLKLDVALPEGEGSSVLGGYRFAFGTAPDEFAVTRNPSNTSSAQITGGSVADQATYSSSFPANGVVVRFTDASAYEVYTQPLKSGDAAIASGSLTTNPPILTIAGAQFSVSGTPASGDQFTLQADTRETQGILETLSTLTTALQTPLSNETSSKLALRDAVASAISNLDKGMNNVLATQASIGARLNTIDTLTTENESLSITNASTQSSIRDTDMAAATSKLLLQQTMLEAAQASFLKISQLSLFNKM
nr:flagellar hook-associated protein 3 [Azomonas macrocytogenes]